MGAGSADDTSKPWNLEWRTLNIVYLWLDLYQKFPYDHIKFKNVVTFWEHTPLVCLTQLMPEGHLENGQEEEDPAPEAEIQTRPSQSQSQSQGFHLEFQASESRSEVQHSEHTPAGSGTYYTILSGRNHPFSWRGRSQLLEGAGRAPLLRERHGDCTRVEGGTGHQVPPG